MANKNIPPVASPEAKAEAFPTEKLKVAEVLLGDRNFSTADLYEESKDGKEKTLNVEKAKAAVDEVEKSFSPKAIEQAKEVVAAREENARILAQSYELKKRHPEAKKMKVSDINVAEQKIATERYEASVVGLKKTLIEDEIIKLRQQHGKDPNFEQLVKEKIVTGVDGKGTGSSLESIRRISVMELSRMNEAREKVDSKENSKVPEVLKKTFGAFSKIKPRALRSVVGTTIFGAALVGGSVAFSLPIAGAAAGYGSYFLYRAARAVVGGTISAFIQKHLTNRVVESAYKVDKTKAFASIKQSAEQSVVEQDIANELMEVDQLEDLSLQTFATDKQLAEEYSKKMKKANRLHVANAIGSGVITGAVGGAAGATALDFGAGEIHDIIGARGKGAVPIPHETVPDMPKGAPAWESSVAGKGDSVWKVVENDLERNIPGFKGMTEAERTYVIDHYKDYVEADPAKFGLTDPDSIKAGWGKELDGLFKNREELTRVIAEAKGLRPEQVENILRTNELNRMHADGITPEAEVPAAPEVRAYASFSPEDQKAYEMAMENYRGASFTKDSAAWDDAHVKGEATLLKLAEDHPEVMQSPEYQDFKVAVRGIYGEHLQKELGEGGMFKFADSADHADLMRETTGLAKTFGLKPQEAEMYAMYLAQGGELDEMSFRPFVNPETGEIIPKAFARSIGQFGATAENNHDLPVIPTGEAASAWEPRMLRVGDHNYLGLVRNIGGGKYEYSIEAGDVQGASGVSMEFMLEQGAKPPVITEEVIPQASAVRPVSPLPVKGLESIKMPAAEPVKLEPVVIPADVEASVAAMQAKLPQEVEQYVNLSKRGAFDVPKPIENTYGMAKTVPEPIKLEKVVIPPDVEANVAAMQAKLPEEVEQYVNLSKRGAFDAPKPIDVSHLSEKPIKLEGVTVPEEIEKQVADLRANSPVVQLQEGFAADDSAKLHNALAGIGKVYDMDAKQTVIFEQYIGNGDTKIDADAMASFVDPETGTPSFGKVVEAMKDFKEVAKRTDLPKDLPGETHSDWEPRKLGIKMGGERIEELGLMRKTGPSTYDMRIGNRAFTSITEQQARQAIEAGHLDDVVPAPKGPSVPPPGSEQTGNIAKGRSPENI